MFNYLPSHPKEPIVDAYVATPVSKFTYDSPPCVLYFFSYESKVVTEGPDGVMITLTAVDSVVVVVLLIVTVVPDTDITIVSTGIPV